MDRAELLVLNQNIGRVIRITRLKKGDTQLVLGAEVGLSDNQIGRIERGISNPTVKTLFSICFYLSISIDKLFLIQSDEEINEIEKEIVILEKLLKSRSRIKNK